VHRGVERLSGPARPQAMEALNLVYKNPRCPVKPELQTWHRTKDKGAGFFRLEEVS
jgi:hypothetical protein